MITANEAKNNTCKFNTDAENRLTKATTDWLENVVNAKIIAASKRGENALTQMVRIECVPSENEAIAKKAVEILTNEKYGFKAKRTEKMETEIEISWGE